MYTGLYRTLVKQLVIDKLLPFLHSIGGRDTTSFVFNIGKGKWYRHGTKIPFPNLLTLGEQGLNTELTEAMLKEAKQLLAAVYSYQGESIANIRTHKFLSSKSVLLKSLPPTDSAFEQHVKHAVYATIVDKSSHLATPTLPDPMNYGWNDMDGSYLPVTTMSLQWPENMNAKLSCACKKGCSYICSCKKRGVQR